MEPTERQAIYELQTGQLYDAIGKCSVKFEHVCFGMHQGITLLLGMNGLRNQRLARVLLAELTAYPLKSILQAMIAEIVSLPPDEKSISDKIFVRVQKLIERRNEIIHSTWFVGWAHPDDTDFSRVSGHKWARGKQGADRKSANYTREDFDAFAVECDLVAALVNRLWVCIMDSNKLTKNFVLDSVGNVACPDR
ncbi:MAG: hypothetical protein KJ852_12990 [Gammaproteobacteria bacterium]|nr:hypothetical protein [Gammaproteobacteria bacterium]MBU0786978.1 hypothetical protein [Gammaproteobacteria bacterium]MBU0816229.1 hypothetical protein [Gammaproteobacteria bacterium]MBU1787866.1 hypothetical protein [Gammaproteobacteria bacterium]